MVIYAGEEDPFGQDTPLVHEPVVQGVLGVGRGVFNTIRDRLSPEPTGENYFESIDPYRYAEPEIDTSDVTHSAEVGDPTDYWSGVDQYIQGYGDVETGGMPDPYTGMGGYREDPMGNYPDLNLPGYAQGPEYADPNFRADLPDPTQAQGMQYADPYSMGVDSQFQMDESDPTYQWRMQQAVEGKNQDLAARGLYKSSAGLDQLEDTRMKVASAEMQDQYGRWQNQQQMQYGMNKDLYGNLQNQYGTGYNVGQNLFGQQQQQAQLGYGMDVDQFNRQTGQNATAYGAGQDLYGQQLQQSQLGYGAGVDRDVTGFNRQMGMGQDIYNRQMAQNDTAYGRGTTQQQNLYGMEQQRGSDLYGRDINFANLGLSGAWMLPTGGASQVQAPNLMPAYQGIGQGQASSALQGGQAQAGYWSGMGGALQNAAATGYYANQMFNTP